MDLCLLKSRLAVCKFSADYTPEASLMALPFVSVTRTPSECSVIVTDDNIPPGGDVESGWRAFRVAGILDFNLTGILVALTAPLAEAHIPIFALSTYDTDYILINEQYLTTATRVLIDEGHNIIREGA